ncbi:hypothetical protein NDU88_004379 [Pleurodeles waltl]|uniref:Uncharacterized protein n=1 Tax=Pleurodeles waltl TaxID=8319 RepID=A0AAV7M6Z0_PLEWA|nr:hypothetical protein NDU88_004379 [Pleurodeles waltl]
MLRSACSGPAPSAPLEGYGRLVLPAPPQAALPCYQFTRGRKSAMLWEIDAIAAASSSRPHDVGKEAPGLCSALFPGLRPAASQSARFKCLATPPQKAF